MKKQKNQKSFQQQFFGKTGRFRNIPVVAVALVVMFFVAYVGVKLGTESQAATGGTITVVKPAGASYLPGSTFTVTVRENSGTNTINALQAVLKYNASHLQYVSMAEGTSFPTIAATDTATAGTIRLARGTAAGTTVSGDRVIVTISFKVLASTSSSMISVDQPNSMLLYSVDNTNMLSSVVGASFVFGSNLALSPASGTNASGSSIAVAVRVDSGTEQINVVQSDITFDPTKLQYVGITEGSIFKTVAATNTDTSGLIRFARATPAGTSSTGNVAVLTINFKVLASTGTGAVGINTPAALVVRSSDNANVLASASNATFAFIGSAGPTIASFTPTNTTISGGTNVVITGTGFVSGATVKFGTVSSSNVVFISSTSLTATAPVLPVGVVSVTVTNPDGKAVSLTGFRYLSNPGDANNDGRVNVLDLSIVITRDGQNFPAADFNGDGTVGAADMSIVLSRWTW